MEEEQKERTELDKDVQDRLYHLRKVILTLEWDEKRNQINESKRAKLRELRQELDKLKKLENEKKANKNNLSIN